VSMSRRYYVQSARNVIAGVFANVGIGIEVSYRVDESEILCSICLEEMDEEEGNIFTVPACSHTFHIDCIAKWQKTSLKCPCCRGPLPAEIGPTSSQQNLPGGDVSQYMTASDIFKNIMLSPLGIAYPFFLFSLCLTLGAILFGPAMVFLFFVLLKVFLDDDDVPLSELFWTLIIGYIFVLVLAVVAFILQIIIVFCKTLLFYAMVFMCKVRWCDAYGFIIDKPISSTIRFIDYNMD